MVIEIRDLWKIYPMGNLEVEALKGVNLDIVEGDFVSVAGPSGSGKTTLMNIIGLIDSFSRGSLVIDGQAIEGQNRRELARLRRDFIGFVFQSFNLLPVLSVFENVELPLVMAKKGGSKAERRDRVNYLLKEVGLEKRMTHTPAELSGGQQQRVAIARAMVNDPAFILADEPTGNLDTGMTLEIMGLFQQLNARGKTIIMVTHEPELAVYTKRVITLRDGQLVSDQFVKSRRNAVKDLVQWKKDHALLAEKTR